MFMAGQPTLPPPPRNLPSETQVGYSFMREPNGEQALNEALSLARHVSGGYDMLTGQYVSYVQIQVPTRLAS